MQLIMLMLMGTLHAIKGMDKTQGEDINQMFTLGIEDSN